MTRLTKEELEAIRKRAEAATPGPWFINGFGDICSKESGMAIAYDTMDEANTEFIAHAREDVPKLLAEIERLQQEKDEWYEKYMRLDATVSMQYSLLQRYEKALNHWNTYFDFSQKVPKDLNELGTQKGVQRCFDIAKRALEESE